MYKWLWSISTIARRRNVMCWHIFIYFYIYFEKQLVYHSLCPSNQCSDYVTAHIWNAGLTFITDRFLRNSQAPPWIHQSGVANLCSRCYFFNCKERNDATSLGSRTNACIEWRPAAEQKQMSFVITCFVVEPPPTWKATVQYVLSQYVQKTQWTRKVIARSFC